MKEFIKKYYWIILLVMAFAAGFLIKWIWSPPDTRDDIQQVKKEREILHKKHLTDSIFYAKTNDSLCVVIDGLKKVSRVKGEEIVRLRAQNKAKVQEIRILDPPETVELFSNRTGYCSELREDSLVISPVASITIANMLIFERDAFELENTALASRMDVQDSIIKNQNTLIGIKDLRITNLTKEYYAHKKIESDQTSIIKKQKRNILTKNVLVGVLGGVAISAIVLTIIK